MVINGQTKFFVTDTWTQIPTGPGFVKTSVMAYGGMLNGVANPDVLYAASGSQIFLRSTAGGTLTATAGQPLGIGTIVSIALDPNNWHRAFVTDGTKVFMTTDAGNTWTNVSGNLNNPSPFNTSLAVIAGTGAEAGVDALLLGGTGAVFRMLTSASAAWTAFGVGLPNTLSGGMVYNSADDVLVDATVGRGAFEVQNASTTVFTGGELLICGDETSPDQNDNFRLVRDSGNNALLDVFINNNTPVPTFQVPLAAVTQINIYGGGGFNTLTVDDSNGVINVPNTPQGITFNAGDPCPMSTSTDGVAPDPPMGEDGTGELILTGSSAAGSPTITSDVYRPGPTPGDGTDVITDSNGNVQYVYFTELTPVYDSVPAATLTANGTNAANAINYIEGNDTSGNPNTAWGQVTVDNQEAMNFTNKDHLIINGLAGDDQTNLNNPDRPTGTTAGGLKDITVNGNDPTASDTLIANGTTGADNINFTPTAADGGGITGAGPVPIIFTTVEHLLINGQGGNDSLTVTGTAGNDTISVTPGSTVDSGSVQVNSLVPLSFLNLGATGQVTIAGGGGTDGLVYNGTPGDDTFIVSATGAITLNNQLVVNTAAINNLTINDLGGNDTVRVFGSTVFPGVVAGTSIPGISVIGGEGNNRLDLVSTLAGEEDVEIDSSLNGNEIFGLGAQARSIKSKPTASTRSATMASTAMATR